MSLQINTQTKVEYKKVAVGTHIAIPCEVIDFGIHHKTVYQSTEKAVNDKTGDYIFNQQVFISFEFPTQTDVFNGETLPLRTGKQFALSLNQDKTSYVHEKSALMKLIMACNPDAETLTDLIGCPVSLTIGLTETGNPKIVAITTAPDEVVLNGRVARTNEMELYNDEKVYSLDDGKNSVYDTLPEWMRERIDNQADELKPKF